MLLSRGNRVKKAATVLFLLTISFLAAAAKVTVQEPVQTELMEGGSVDLGVVGPGQKIEVQISRKAGEVDYRKSEYLWDKLYVEPRSLPSGWQGLDSLYYEEKMKAFVIVARDAPDGFYSFELSTERDYGGVQPLYFSANVEVRRDVLELTAIEPVKETGAGQPAVFLLRISNKGNANDAFEVGVTGGLPKAWSYKKSVFVERQSDKIVPYEIVASDQGQYSINVRATSLSSELIKDDEMVVVASRSSLLEEMRAASKGVILFPAIEQSIYNLLGFIAANFFS